MPRDMLHPFLIDALPEDQRRMFVLGYEFGTFWDQIKTGEPFEVLVHSENEERLMVLLSRCKRTYKKWSLKGREWIEFTVNAR
jgi:hypothetical protein